MDLSPSNYDTAAGTLAMNLSRINGQINHDQAHAAILVGFSVASTPSMSGQAVGDLMALFDTLFPADFGLCELATLGAHLSQEEDLDRALELFLDDEALDIARKEDPRLDSDGDRLNIVAHYIAAMRRKDRLDT